MEGTGTAAAAPPFATTEDYSARYGEPADPARVAVLLADAADMLLSAYERRWGAAWVAGAHPAFDRAAAAVCCHMVNQAVSAPAALAGATQYSQGAGGYTASVTYGSALGDLWLGKSDLRRLGLDGAAIRAIYPEVRDA